MALSGMFFHMCNEGRLSRKNSARKVSHSRPRTPLAMSHTILLIQPTARADSRTWSDYETTSECLEGICKIYEEFLKKQTPAAVSITYDASSLFEFIDKLTDLSCLVYDQDSAQYTPHNKDWVKERIYAMLRNQARPGEA